MKKALLLVILLTGGHRSFAQLPSGCNVPPVLQYYYDRDVKHLALKRIYEQQAPARDSIIIPQIYQDTVWQAMAAIYNLSGFPPRDSVFDLYCVHHAISNYIFSSIYVKLTYNCPWLQNWKNLVTTTGVPALDSLFSDYGFSVVYFSNYNNVATLSTNQVINVRPVCDSIETFSGVVYAEPRPVDGAGNEIRYSKTGTDRFLEFEVGYGDCFSGCIGALIFYFNVHNDCSVDYLGSVLYPASGYPFPNPSNCYITTMTGQVPKKWTGAASDEWNEDGNWNPTGPPMLEDARISAGVPRMPVIRSSGMSCGNLFIDHGATVTVLPDIILTVQGKMIINP